MTFALVLFHDAAPGTNPVVPEGELAALRALLAGVPGLTEALVFTPATAKDSYTDDGASPPLGMQLHFARLEELEAACAQGGALQGLAAALPSLAGTEATAQAFWRRTWAVADPVPQVAPGALPCSFVVHYPGPAEDDNAWHAHYMHGHPPLFQRLPGPAENLASLFLAEAVPVTNAMAAAGIGGIGERDLALSAAARAEADRDERANWTGLIGAIRSLLRG